jgi:hypothetical protein
MSNYTEEYNDFIRANLPGYIKYDPVRARYVTFNGKMFPTYLQAKWYCEYVIKTGFPQAKYSENNLVPNLILDFENKFYSGS